MNVTIGMSIFLLYGTFIVLYFLINRRKSIKIYKRAYAHSLICYCLCFLAFEIIPSGGREGVNFVPFVNFLKLENGARIFELTYFLEYILNAVLNILLYLPPGVFIAVHCRMNYIGGPAVKALLLGAALSVFTELLQWALPFGRFCNIDDVIFNILGALTGALIFNRVQNRPAVHGFLKKLRLSDDVEQILS